MEGPSEELERRSRYLSSLIQRTKLNPVGEPEKRHQQSAKPDKEKHQPRRQHGCRDVHVVPSVPHIAARLSCPVTRHRGPRPELVTVPCRRQSAKARPALEAKGRGARGHPCVSGCGYATCLSRIYATRKYRANLVQMAPPRSRPILQLKNASRHGPLITYMYEIPDIQSLRDCSLCASLQDAQGKQWFNCWRQVDFHISRVIDWLLEHSVVGPAARRTAEAYSLEPEVAVKRAMWKFSSSRNTKHAVEQQV